MQASDSKLYQWSGSPNSRRVRIFVAEKGISIPMVPIDLGAKEQFSDAYAAINPRGVIPTLVLGDGTAIGEVRRSCATWRTSIRPAAIRYSARGEGPSPPCGGSDRWSSKGSLR